MSVLELFLGLEFLDLSFIHIFLLSHKFELIVFIGELLFMNSFGFELILLFLSHFLNLLHLLFELIFKVGDLFLEL